MDRMYHTGQWIECITQGNGWNVSYRAMDRMYHTGQWIECIILGNG